MHARVYLSYLHIHFQVYRLLGNGDGNMTFQPELLEVSENMLETVIQMTNCRGRTSYSFLDLPGIVCTSTLKLRYRRSSLIDGCKILSYGLPCAAILLTALDPVIQESSKETKLPPSLKTSNIIRNLSVLVSQLESVSSPNETNYVFCLKSSQAISRKLDHILDSFTTANSTKPPDYPEPVPAPHTLDNTSFEAMANIENIGLVNFGHFDLADWAIDFGIGTMSDEWNMF